jgi:hypothetical protein
VKNRSLTGGVESVATVDRGPPEPGLTRTPPHRWVVNRHRLVKVPFTVLSLGVYLAVEDDPAEHEFIVRFLNAMRDPSLRVVRLGVLVRLVRNCR